MKANYLMGLLILSILLLSGCTQQQIKYVCSDGSTVLDSSLCPKQETKQAYQQPIPYCGDGICQSSENCSSCSSDCGTCKTQGQISFVRDIGDNHGEFFESCSGEGYPAWCEQISINKNEFNVYVKTVKGLPFNPNADFTYRIENLGTEKVENIESTLLCDEISPENKKWAITDSSTSYNGLILSDNFFNCATCSGNCACDKYPQGNKVTYLMGGRNVDRWLVFNVGQVNSDITLSCDIKAFSETPSQSISTNLIIHFLANR